MNGHRTGKLPPPPRPTARPLAPLSTGILALALASPAGMAAVKSGDLPPPVDRTIDFRADILPILENHCFRCHGPERPRSGLRLDNRESAVAGGDNGPDIILRNSSDSPLIHYVSRLVPNMEMPPPGKGEPLKPFEIALLRAWIDQGLDYGGADKPERARLAFDLTTGAGFVAVSGDQAKFRELSWLNDGGSGGVSRFNAQGPIDDQTDFSMDGRVLFGQHDATIRFDVKRKEWGGLTGGFETRRKWFDDRGGYHPDFAPPQFAAGADPHLDFGRAWIDLYIDREDWPSMRLGYELQYRDGQEATTQWGVATINVNLTRNILPVIRSVDEETHILKFDLAKVIAGWRVEDNFRFEWHRQSHDQGFQTLVGGAGQTNSLNEIDHDTQGANSLLLEKSPRSWCSVSLGYLYSWLDGSGTFDGASFLADGQGGFNQLTLTSNRILFDRQANVGSLGLRLGPWQEFTLYGGLQGDWSEQHGLSDASLQPAVVPGLVFPVLAWSDIDRQLIEERAGLRYAGLPFSTLYAEGRWQQEDLDQFEDQTLFGSPLLHRRTDASAHLAQYRFGFTTSPWQYLLWSAHYEIIDHSSHYDPIQDDASYGPLGAGYPNFIRERDLDANEFETSLTLRLAPRLKTKLGYQIGRSDYETTHFGITNQFPTIEVITPAGTIDAGRQQAQVVSLGVNWSPWSRLGLDLTGSYADTRLDTFANGSAAVVPFDGQIWSLIASLDWTVDDWTRLSASYAWSQADYQQQNFAAGLPLGIDYQWHQLRATVERQLNKQLSVSLLYLFQTYREPSSAGLSDYTAHGVFAGLTWRWNK